MDGIFRVVVTKAVDVNEAPRRIAACHPVEWRMRITELDDATGQFKAEFVP